MGNSNDTIAEFMIKTNKSGDEIELEEQNSNDNRLPTLEKAKYYDTATSNNDNDKIIELVKYALKTIMVVPLIIGAAIGSTIIILKSFPYIVSFIKMLLF